MKAKILIGTNILATVDSSVYSNHVAFYCTLARNRDIKLMHCAPGRYSIDRMRNMCAKVALENDCTHVLFIDDDVLVQPGTVESLIETDLDIVMADTFIRGYPFHRMSFKRQDSKEGIYNLTYFDDADKVAENGVARCEAVGFSCCLIKTWLLKELEEPFFLTSPNSTEDIYFCMRCLNDIQGGMIDGKWQGKEVKIGVDLRVPTGHLLDKEAINIFTLEALKEFYEKSGRKPVVEPEHENRADKYLAEIESLTVGATQEEVVQ